MIDPRILRRVDPQRLEVAREYGPKYDEWEAAALRLVSADPRLAETFDRIYDSGARAAAYDYALTALGARARQVYGDLDRGSWQAREGMVQASIPNMRHGESRRGSDPQVAEAKALAALKAKARNGNRGDREAYGLARIKQTLAHPDLSAEGPGTIPVQGQQPVFIRDMGDARQLEHWRAFHPQR